MSSEKKIWTIANILTMLRVVLAVPIIIALHKQQVFWIVFWEVLAIATDLLDGYLARKLNQQSDFGRILDPVADKLLILGVTGFMAFSSLYDFPLWFFLLLVIREMVIMIGSLFVIRKKTAVMESNRAGKSSAFVTGLAVLLYTVRIQPYALYLLYVGLALTIYSSFVYFQLFLKQMKNTN